MTIQHQQIDTPYAETDLFLRVRRGIESVRAPLTRSEYELHALVAEALRREGLTFEHEVPIAPRCRIDFLVGNVGIEIKRGKPDPARLRNQCARYLAGERLRALILVVDTRARLPERINGKQLTVIGLNRLWGIALP